MSRVNPNPRNRWSIDRPPGESFGNKRRAGWDGEERNYDREQSSEHYRGYPTEPNYNKYHHDDKRRRRDEENVRGGALFYSDNPGSRENDSHYGRGDDWERNKGSRQSFPPHSDWKCLECNAWNYPDKNLCFRCGTPMAVHWGQGYDRERDCDRDFDRDRDRGRNSDSGRQLDRNRCPDRGRHRHFEDDRSCPSDGGKNIDKGEEEDIDEFGRKTTATAKNKSREWPPCFTVNGSSFVFDSRSAMFYEAESDFFYDPKSKLYYGNKKGAYYRYDDSLDPPFEVVHKVASSTTGGLPADSTVDLDPVNKVNSADANAVKEEKNVISIKLKSKLGFGKSKKDKPKESVLTSKPSVASPTVTSRVHKQHAANIEKWSEREKEIKSAFSERADEKALNNANDNQGGNSEGRVIKTTKGQPVCLLCKRKFATIPKLRVHEKKSELHKQNLAKKEQAVLKDSKSKLKQADPAISVSEYRDRAQQRRDLYGPEVVVPPPVLMADNGSTNENSGAILRPQDALGNTNIGHQLLQKLGWKAGSNLGRKSSFDEGEKSTSQTSLRGNLQGALVRDWERIESIAGNKNA